MDIYSLLNANCEKMLQQYHSNLETVRSLQATFIYDILPDVKHDMDLDDEAVDWAREWLQDTASIFQLLRRHNFTRSFAMESIRTTLVWRLTSLRPHVQNTPMRRVLWLPDSDPFGRPIVILKATAINDSIDEFKRLLMPAMDHLRRHLKRLNDGQENGHPARPILQYVVLLDLKELAFQSISIDVISWTLQEAIPRFPGMLAAAFIVNHSWAHSGIWGVAKCALPATALSRVFFPSREQLLEYFSPSVLPKEYGGTLPAIAEAQADPNDCAPSPLLNSADLAPTHPSLPSDTLILASASSNTTSIISPTSLVNPFFGYPVRSSAASHVHVLPHGRRRKRDLVRTLAVLLWARWRNHIKALLSLILVVLTIRLATRKWLRGLKIWKILLR